MKENQLKKPLTFHRVILLVCYLLSLCICILVLINNEANITKLTLLSTSAILATLGSAIATIGSTFQSDLSERIKTNRDILINSIYPGKVIEWKRWPFLKRVDSMRLLYKSTLVTTLQNQKFQFDVGSHNIDVELPTVQEDYFDLSIVNNLGPLLRYNKPIFTLYSRKRGESKNEQESKIIINEVMAYECILDIWKSVLKYRICRYLIHIGSSITIISIMIFLIRVIFTI